MIRKPEPRCTLCGSPQNVRPFHRGGVCEDCLKFIRSAEDGAFPAVTAAPNSDECHAQPLQQSISP